MNAIVKVQEKEGVGVVVASTKNPEYASIMVKSEQLSMENGFANKQTKIAFIHGNKEMLEGLGFSKDQILPGQVITKRSYEPFYANQDVVRYPATHPTKAGQAVLREGREFYMENTYTSDYNAPSEQWVNSTVSVAENNTVEQDRGAI